ncbi:MAG: iron-containing alcohol dehydrogenase, partial [Pseudomonadota bacterium]
MLPLFGREPLDLLQPQDWTFPVPIAYGPGCLATIGARCAAMEIEAPLIMTDRGSRSLGFVGELQRLLAEAGLRTDLFAEISP